MKDEKMIMQKVLDMLDQFLMEEGGKNFAPKSMEMVIEKPMHDVQDEEDEGAGSKEDFLKDLGEPQEEWNADDEMGTDKEDCDDMKGKKPSFEKFFGKK